MSDEIQNIVTPDDLMEEFISDMVVADDELSDSIFTCVDNYIDDLCIKTMDDENSIFESDNDSDTPFTYILDKVMEKVDNIVEIQADAYCDTLKKELLEIDDGSSNRDDPDYCEGIDFSEITPEDFQLFINVDTREDEEDSYDERRYMGGAFDDANFNA